jgi:hypothetical protein
MQQEVGPSIQDIIDGGGGGCFPQPAEPELPFGLPPLTDIWGDGGWDDGGCFGEPSPWPGLPYDLFGEDNGEPSMPFGLLDEETIREINGESSGGGLFDSLGGIGGAVGGGIFDAVGGIGDAIGGGGLFGGIGGGGLGGALGGGIGGAVGGILSPIKGALDIVTKAAGGGGIMGDTGCLPGVGGGYSPFEDMIVY